MEAFAGELDHGVVEVECGDVAGLEPVEDDFGADTSSAAGLEYVLAGEVATGEAAKPCGFPRVVMGSPNRGVHRCPVDGVELHRATSAFINRKRCHRLIPINLCCRLSSRYVDEKYGCCAAECIARRVGGGGGVVSQSVRSHPVGDRPPPSWW